MRSAHFILILISLFLIIFIFSNLSRSQANDNYLLDEVFFLSPCFGAFVEQERFQVRTFSSYGAEEQTTIYHCVRKGPYVAGQLMYKISHLAINQYNCEGFPGFQESGWFEHYPPGSSTSEKISLCVNYTTNFLEGIPVLESLIIPFTCPSSMIPDGSFLNAYGVTINHCISATPQEIIQGQQTSNAQAESGDSAEEISEFCSHRYCPSFNRESCLDHNPPNYNMYCCDWDKNHKAIVSDKVPAAGCEPEKYIDVEKTVPSCVNKPIQGMPKELL